MTNHAGAEAARSAPRIAARLALAVLMPLMFWACATQPKPPPEPPDIPMAAYTTFELPPVVNDSGNPAGAEAALVIGQGIAAELKSRGYNIVASAPAEAQPLLIKCALKVYQPDASSGGRGATQITLNVSFTDMKNGHPRGSFDDAQNVEGGGIETDREILLGFARGAAIQIDARVKQAPPPPPPVPPPT
ncbi:MAG TPA: hypothetical protein VFB33_04525 [Candidatus Binataceae bacterium]|jgi:hypothetical protein|nr:hypothetical protein [Candidatus Binataceae bacterium]